MQCYEIFSSLSGSSQLALEILILTHSHSSHLLCPSNLLFSWAPALCPPPLKSPSYVLMSDQYHINRRYVASLLPIQLLWESAAYQESARPVPSRLVYYLIHHLLTPLEIKSNEVCVSLEKQYSWHIDTITLVNLKKLNLNHLQCYTYKKKHEKCHKLLLISHGLIELHKGFWVGL